MCCLQTRFANQRFTIYIKLRLGDNDVAKVGYVSEQNQMQILIYLYISSLLFVKKYRYQCGSKGSG